MKWPPRASRSSLGLTLARLCPAEGLGQTGQFIIAHHAIWPSSSFSRPHPHPAPWSFRVALDRLVGWLARWMDGNQRSHLEATSQIEVARCATSATTTTISIATGRASPLPDRRASTSSRLWSSASCVPKAVRAAAGQLIRVALRKLRSAVCHAGALRPQLASRHSSKPSWIVQSKLALAERMFLSFGNEHTQLLPP